MGNGLHFLVIFSTFLKLVLGSSLICSLRHPPSAMAMASSSSLFNFLSFLLPTQITKKSPPQIISTPSHCDSRLPSLSSSSSSTTTNTCSVSFLNRRNRDGFVPLTPIKKSSSENDLLAVVCPSLAYSNILFYASHVVVFVDEDESEESLISRFRRQVLRARVLQECRRRRHHETSQEKRKRRSREAAKRFKRRHTPWRDQIEDKEEEALKEEEEKRKAEYDEEQDNWEYYEGGIPYY